MCRPRAVRQTRCIRACLPLRPLGDLLVHLCAESPALTVAASSHPSAADSQAQRLTPHRGVWGWGRATQSYPLFQPLLELGGQPGLATQPSEAAEKNE